MNGWDAAITDHCAFARAGGISEGTIRLRRLYLARFAEHVHHESPWGVTLDQLVDFLAHPGWEPETRKSARSALRMFYRWADATDRIRADPTRLLQAVRVPAGKPKPAPEAVIARAILAADRRGRLMIYLALLAGMRRHEIAKVHTDDIEGDELRVAGKGGRVRMLPLHPKLAEALAACEPGYVLPGRIDGHLSLGHVGKVLGRLLGPGWTGHCLRHTAASRWYAVERDLVAVQELLGHAKPETTRRYTAVPDGAMRAAVFGAASA